MTSRERLLAVAAGQTPDRRPLIDRAWNEESDARLETLAQLRERRAANKPESGERLALVEIVNPFGMALERGVDLNGLLGENPEAGAQRLDQLAAEAREAIESALKLGADGVFYVLAGACARWSTPMQYGGFYLERDRELLESASGAAFNALYVAGDSEVYLDFVSDLPASAFAWDSESTGVGVREVKAMRSGPCLAADPEAEIAFQLEGEPAAPTQRESATAHV